MPIEVDPQEEAATQTFAAASESLKPLTDVVALSSAFPAEPDKPHRSQPEKLQKPAKPRRRASRSIETWSGSAAMYWVFEVLLGIAMILIAAMLWRQDGRFTIRFIESQIPGFKQAATWQQWMIPVFFTAGFLGAYPRKSLRDKMRKALDAWHKTHDDDDAERYYALRNNIAKRFVAATVIQLVNMATSFSGLILSISGKTYEFFVPITFPQQGLGLLIPTFLIAGVLAFGPEIITRWAVPYLWNLIIRAWEIVTNGVPTRVKA